MFMFPKGKVLFFLNLALRERNIFTMTSGGFVIVVKNNSFIDSK